MGIWSKTKNVIHFRKNNNLIEKNDIPLLTSQNKTTLHQGKF